ncbi:hypothetical protein ACC668_17680 [Rhizobium ruizarguesonis]
MSTKSVKMPNGGDEKINGDSIFVIRELGEVEKEESRTSNSCIWGGSYRIYPTETVSDLVRKFDDVKFAELTAPGGMLLLVNAAEVTDRDERSNLLDHENTGSVLCFGVGRLAPRVRVREKLDDLRVIWTKLGVPTDPLD